ncbi:HAD hydrolase family protein [Porphyromonas uenonis]|uniref:HAD hydrolase family protein n=1 Tax=Porphyromonas uenonis TaxID=281920 RepID=UPI0026EC3C88|nr:HAD hydrolase family protein [Porphyromonas uenonis]
MTDQAKSGGYKFLAIKDRDCLLGSNGQISLEDREALLEVQEEYALRVAIASEAPMTSLLKLSEQLQLPRNSGYIISHLGARVHNCRTGRELASRPLRPAELTRLYELVNSDYTLALIGEKALYATKTHQPRVLQLAKLWGLPILELVEADESFQAPSEPIFRALILARQDRLEKLSERLKAEQTLTATLYDEPMNELSIVASGVSLRGALDFILDRLDLNQQNIIAVGTTLEDVAMVQRAGLGVAMANAPESLKSCADYITTSCDAAGLAHMITKQIKLRYDGVPFDPEDANAIMPNTLMGALGMRCTEIAQGYVTGTMPVDSRTRQPMGILHGGASLAFAETLAGLGSVAIADEGEIQVGMQVSGYHVSSTVVGDTVRGVATILHKGRSTHVWNVDIYSTQSGKLISTCRVINSILKQR